jgi:hypothetical protein
MISGYDVSASTAVNMYARVGLSYKCDAVGEAQGEVYMTVLTENHGRTLPARGFVLVAPTNSPAVQPVSEWLPASMVTYVKAAFVQNNPSHIRFRLVWQWASTSTQVVSDWEGVEDPAQVWYDDEDLEFVSEEMRPATEDEMWIRFGVEFESDTEGVQARSILTSILAFRKG